MATGEKWLMYELPERALLSLDEVVRVEIGPQIIEMECNPKNLSNLVTHPNYQVGKPDAAGRIIGKDIQMGERMRVVDWRADFVPRLWKVYKWELRQINPPQMAWVKQAEYEEFDDALTHARRLRKEMVSDAVHF